ncbi:UDP-N-acetylglucosamine--N-acetylmuramyl-(pentapeptide) pyrophosphoryl-undecaprenol N-acetylglucosamine transferase [Kocuria sp. HSID16901]|uniref:UDP-N-acetylglucosamine--N-acetylmuramyl- (pentapeptide) pyrophosphoryl-undecaprenol N-acetylglucosamine transferase n=1 Tax=Kocuria sp. HSID16901 TaxID=2419505 RepID=UPI0006606FA2|nr:UDP-N-acetylglucosamine--N-acetylmuramyl-(pentapeptide) pyrophosphoryl-undecaprenol N-acetylglucosamine transferase [Kocuria sp. HSID16901]RUQ20486.1 UDP-N-acetylglucosamine--N-acetylmuramyl-(pentapeptide) pyrophosphoryl-undecaprenol N-acetylglucosamine transferase [Kocuria sp. HSID16901]
MTQPLSVVVAGGGTAGHISPLLAIADAVRERHPEAKIVAVGTKTGMETRLVPEAGYDLEFVDRVPMPRKPSLDLLKLPLRMRRAVRQGQEILRRAEADVLVGVGGYVCTPLYLAAARENVPVVIHEANQRPGLANKVGAKKAVVVATAFEGTPIAGGRHVGMPMSRRIAECDRAAERSGSRQLLALQDGVPTIIVTGGSLGAQNMNRTIAEVLRRREWVESGVQMLHITGRGKQLLDDDGSLLNAPGYHQVEFVNGMEKVYSACDLLIARSGAATVSEVAAVGCPAVFVPLPIGNGEQALNAAGLVGSDAALLVEDKKFNADWFVSSVLPVVTNSERLTEMSRNGYRHGIRDAAQQMAELIDDAASQGGNH